MINDLATPAGSNSVLIDDAAAGQGWFIGASPDMHSDFDGHHGGDHLAQSGSAAAARVDLLTVVMHELGHILGLSDLRSNLRTGLDHDGSTGCRFITDFARNHTACEATTSCPRPTGRSPKKKAPPAQAIGLIYSE